jgi:predicted nucleic acid-binding protein
MVVVSNATPLIYLAAIGRFELLQNLFERITIPEAVYEEVVTNGAGGWGATETAKAEWIERRRVSTTSTLGSLPTNLNGGELEVISLAVELPANLVIMDEFAGRAELARRKMPVVGTVGVLIQAKRRNLIPALAVEMDRLKACGFRLSERIYRACLAEAGE